MRYIFLIVALCVVVVVAVAGKRGDLSRRPPIELFPDMDRQPKLRPQAPNDFFPDGRSSRLIIPGTVARGEHFEDTPANTGRLPGGTNLVESIPVEITEAMLNRGQQRFNINCSPCHGAMGDGNGITKRIGAMGVVADLHDPRVVKLTDGELFNTITYGKNLMGAYGPNVPVEDRWAIIAYLRTLQLSRLGTIDEVPAPFRTQFKK